MITDVAQTANGLAEDLASRGVRYALASFVDLHGISKAKAVPLGHLDQMMHGSELFTGAALDGVPQQVNDEEVSARPDADSVTVLPWNRRSRGSPAISIWPASRSRDAAGASCGAVLARCRRDGLHVQSRYRNRVLRRA